MAEDGEGATAQGSPVQGDEGGGMRGTSGRRKTFENARERVRAGQQGSNSQIQTGKTDVHTL